MCHITYIQPETIISCYCVKFIRKSSVLMLRENCNQLGSKAPIRIQTSSIFTSTKSSPHDVTHLSRTSVCHCLSHVWLLQPQLVSSITPGRAQSPLARLQVYHLLMRGEGLSSNCLIYDRFGSNVQVQVYLYIITVSLNNIDS